MALFWTCLALILYVYLGYPLLLISGLLGRRRPAHRAKWSPTLSVIVPAYNEAGTIESKLENLLSQDYPRGKVEILVGSDGSTDATADKVRAYEGVILIDGPVRRGKSATQNSLVKRASGAVLVFTDADCLLPPDSLRVMAENLADPDVKLVTSCATFTNKDETSVVASESLYWRYERWLRQQESDRGLLAMASGSLFALRRDSWKPLDPNVGDDFVLPLQVVQSGYRNILEPSVSAATRLTQNQMHSMLRMKMRIISKDLRGLLLNYRCLNPLRHGTIATGLWSHKLLRWLVPYFLLLILVSNLFLLSGRLFEASLGFQVLFYAAGFVGAILGEWRSRFPFSTVASFCLVNLAALLGTLHCMTGQPAGQWRTVR